MLFCYVWLQGIDPTAVLPKTGGALMDMQFRDLQAGVERVRDVVQIQDRCAWHVEDC